MTIATWFRRLATAGFVGWFARRELAVIVVDAPERGGVVIDARERFGGPRPTSALESRRSGVQPDWNARRHAGTRT